VPVQRRRPAGDIVEEYVEWHRVGERSESRRRLIVVAPELLRAPLRGVSLARQLERIEALSSRPDSTVERRIIVLTLRSIAAGSGS
jgi:hypothetical protein